MAEKVRVRVAWVLADLNKHVASFIQHQDLHTATTFSFTRRFGTGDAEFSFVSAATPTQGTTLGAIPRMSRHATRQSGIPLDRLQISRGYRVCVSCFHESVGLPAYRCVDCDREVCSLCVVRIRMPRENLCPECARERQDMRGA